MSGQFCLLILYLVAICQISSGPHGPIFNSSSLKVDREEKSKDNGPVLNLSEFLSKY